MTELHSSPWWPLHHLPSSCHLKLFLNVHWSGKKKKGNLAYVHFYTKKQCTYPLLYIYVGLDREDDSILKFKMKLFFFMEKKGTVVKKKKKKGLGEWICFPYW